MKSAISVGLALALLVAAAAASFASGDAETGGWISGSGMVRTEERAVTGFTGIEVEGSGNVTVSEGPQWSVIVETDANLLPVVKTDVVGNVLHLGFKPFTHIGHVSRLEFRITAPRISAITISGSGDVQAATPLHGEAMELAIRGSGNIEAPIAATRLLATIGGSGDISAKGTTDSLEVTINGSGGFSARGLRSKSAEVHINGSGDAEIFATDTVNIDIAGSGSVSYGGGAKAFLHASGSGTVTEY